MIGNRCRERVRWADQIQGARTEPALRPDGPDQREYEPRQREQRVGERAHEEQRQQRDHEQRQPHQRQHAGARGLLILLLNHRERHAAHAQRALVRLRQVVDRQLRVVNGLVAGVAQPDGGDRDPACHPCPFRSSRRVPFAPVGAPGWPGHGQAPYRSAPA